MKKAANEIRLTAEVYPNNQAHISVWLGNERIGNIDIVEGGYIPSGRRKSIINLHDAAREAVWTRSRRALKDAARFSAALEFDVNSDAVDPIAANPGTPSTRV